MKTCLSLDQSRAQTLYDKYDMYGLPRLLVLSSSCEKITSDGANEFLAASKRVLQVLDFIFLLTDVCLVVNLQ